MVGWVRRSLALAPPAANATAEECLKACLHALDAERHEDWQVEQARMAVTAWLGWRRARAAQTALTPVAKLCFSADSTADPGRALDTLTETMRVRHCSCRTEQTCLDWVRRLFEHLVSDGQVANGRPVLTEETFQNFITHLATRARGGEHAEPGVRVGHEKLDFYEPRSYVVPEDCGTCRMGGGDADSDADTHLFAVNVYGLPANVSTHLMTLPIASERGLDRMPVIKIRSRM